jgi:hypothetical protein
MNYILFLYFRFFKHLPQVICDLKCLPVHSTLNILIDPQNNKVYGLCLWSEILNSYKTQRFGNWSFCHLQLRGGRRLFYWVPLKELTSFIAHLLRLAPSKESNRVGVSISWPEDGNRSSFQNVLFSSYLKFLDAAQSPLA